MKGSSKFLTIMIITVLAVMFSQVWQNLAGTPITGTEPTLSGSSVNAAPEAAETNTKSAIQAELQATPKPTISVEALKTQVYHQEMAKVCEDATLYNSPSLSDFSAQPLSYAPKGIHLPIVDRYGSWSLISYAVAQKDLWVLTADLENENGVCE